MILLSITTLLLQGGFIMAKLTKEWLEKKLKAISKGIDKSEQDDYNWYFDIL